MDHINLAVAEAVRTEIRRAGMTESAVAQEAGIKPSTWYRRMHGRRTFTVSELARVARSVGARAGALLDAALERAS